MYNVESKAALFFEYSIQSVRQVASVPNHFVTRLTFKDPAFLFYIYVTVMFVSMKCVG